MTRLLVIILLVALPGVCSASVAGKMSPFVRQLCLEHSAARSLTPSWRGGCELCAFVQVSGSDAGRVLGSAGCRLLAQRGSVCVAMIPVDRLGWLAAQPQVLRIEASPSGRAQMDTTRTIVNAIPVYEGRDLPQAYTGRGVVMGVVDIGFDLGHPTFLTADGTRCRISRFWDQLSSDTIGSELPVGRDFVSVDGRRPTDCSTDALTQFHGTHTAGIAGGSGCGWPYVGMAPEADLCFVSNAVTADTLFIDEKDYYKYTSATDALAFKYIFDYADSVGSPCVVSFSEGYHPVFDEEDYLYEAFLDSLTGPGHILVSSAGNESINHTYLDKPAGMPVAGSYAHPDGDTFSFFLRSHGGDPLLNVIITKNTLVPIDTFSYRLSAMPPCYYTSLDSAYTRVDSLMANDVCFKSSISKYVSAYNPLDTILCVTLQADQPILESNEVAVIIEGADADAEIFATSSFVNQGKWRDAEVRSNILQPGNFERVVCVGSTVHRNTFYNYKGDYRDYKWHGTNGVIAYYSSVGPTYSGLTKPDVCAPGDNVVSGMSSYYIAKYPNSPDVATDLVHFDYDGRTYGWNASYGTSMSTPVVGGAVALWLQANPRLTPEDVLDVLRRTSRHTVDDIAYPNNSYGYGEIDVWQGLKEALLLSGISDATLDQRPMAHKGVFDLQGRRVDRNRLRRGLYIAGGKKYFSR